jgi:DNA-directed RNA polymerase subunit RPC12/RpoP
MVHKCLNCEKEFDAKRETAKYCSTNCRVKFFNKNGKNGAVTKLDLKVVYNELLDLAQKLSASANQPKVFDAQKLPTTHSDEPKQWQETIHTQQPLDKVAQFLENIAYADSRKEIERYLAQAKKELSSNWKSFLDVQRFAAEIMEKKGFIYND